MLIILLELLCGGASGTLESELSLANQRIEALEASSSAMRTELDRMSRRLDALASDTHDAESEPHRRTQRVGDVASERTVTIYTRTLTREAPSLAGNTQRGRRMQARGCSAADLRDSLSQLLEKCKEKDTAKVEFVLPGDFSEASDTCMRLLSYNEAQKDTYIAQQLPGHLASLDQLPSGTGIRQLIISAFVDKESNLSCKRGVVKDSVNTGPR